MRLTRYNVYKRHEWKYQIRVVVDLKFDVDRFPGHDQIGPLPAQQAMIIESLRREFDLEYTTYRE